MSRHSNRILWIALLLAPALMATGAKAMSLKECSVRYQAAKKDGSLGTRNWDTFRQAECGMTATKPATKPATSAAAENAVSKSAETVTATAAATSSATAARPAATTPAQVATLADLPTAIDPKYAAEKPARARLHTCADSYRAHKKVGTLGGLKWLQKGGGFYSQCNRKLKAGG